MYAIRSYYELLRQRDDFTFSRRVQHRYAGHRLDHESGAGVNPAHLRLQRRTDVAIELLEQAIRVITRKVTELEVEGSYNFV